MTPTIILQKFLRKYSPNINFSKFRRNLGAVIEIGILTNEFEFGHHEILDKSLQLHSITSKNLGAVEILVN